MSDYLYATFSLDAKKKEQYWWPLIFEAMHRASFTFTSPHSGSRNGVYFSNRESDEIVCSFRDVWTTLYDEKDSGILSFWIPGEDFCLDVSLVWMDHAWQLDITIENSRLDDDNQMNMKRQVSVFVQSCLAVYDLCTPSAVRMYWDEDILSYPKQLSLISLIAMPANETSSQMIDFRGHQLQWRAVASLHNYTIFLVDPFPLWVGKRWQYISVIDV